VVPGGTAQTFGTFMQALITAQGDACSVRHHNDGIEVTQTGWRLMDDLERPHLAIAHAWNGLMQGALAAHNHRLMLHTQIVRVHEQFHFTWTIRPAPRTQ
jgi:hypothetical protein